MTAEVIPLPTAYLAERIEDAHIEVAFCAMKVRRAQADLEQRTGELEMARQDLADLEAQRLGWCGTCKTHHQPPQKPCPEPGPCVTCGQHSCLPGCFERGSDE